MTSQMITLELGKVKKLDGFQDHALLPTQVVTKV